MLYGFDERQAAACNEVSLPRKLVHEILTFFAKTYAEVFGLTQGPPAHDPLAVAAIVFKDLFHDNDGERYAIAVITEGLHGSSVEIRSSESQCGRTIATLLSKGTAGVRIPRSLEKDQLWRLLEGCLTRISAKGSS